MIYQKTARYAVFQCNFYYYVPCYTLHNQDIILFSQGFTGDNCEVNVDDCVDVVCDDPLKICVDGVNQHECLCKPGYQGMCTEKG